MPSYCACVKNVLIDSRNICNLLIDSRNDAVLFHAATRAAAAAAAAAPAPISAPASSAVPG